MSDNLFKQQLTKKILILDGAMGTMIQAANLSSEDYGGKAFEGCNEYLNFTAPHLIESIHAAYLAAGADIIATNSFGGTTLVLDEYDLGTKAFEINKKAAQLAKKAARKFTTSEWPRFVAGSMGPTTKSLSIMGGISFEELTKHYEIQVAGLLEGGVDLLLLETCQDTLNIKAAYVAIQNVFRTTNKNVPIIISGTIEHMGTTLAGQNIEAFYISVEHMHPLAVGLNCAAGPEFLREHVRTLSELSSTAVICYPNAGLPNEDGAYSESPAALATQIADFARQGWLNITGGCCGTTPEHIKAIAEAVKDFPPRNLSHAPHPHTVAGLEPLIYDPSMRPLMVGERTNVIGSKKFRTLIADKKYEEASEIAKDQVKNGAHVVDICLANPDSDELHDMEAFIQHVVNKVKVPLVIDSTDEKVIERALTYSQGKAIINSVNLEEGQERLEKFVPLIHKFGAALVVGTIDEAGMALTSERKLAVAERAYDLLVNNYGINASDIIFDPLVFPVGTGDEQYLGSAKATVEALRLIKNKYPHSMTILGISNVSFGLPPLGREVLNSVFLYHCTQAGLDYAIVNTENLERFASISTEEIALAEDILFKTSSQAIARFTAFYRDKTKEAKTKSTELKLPERLANYVVEGVKNGLQEDLEKALLEYASPLEIINGPLMTGMAEVGRLFNNNQLIVAEVLQSAEVMKTAVSFLEPTLENEKASAAKGKFVLATVKGDVHDIGKNLVDIILSNNGFKVIDLGTKVSSDELISVITKEKPDLIGLSGLLVKSAQQMVLTAQDLKRAGISIPILVGGAALSQSFTEKKIAAEYDGQVLYARDAMEGLSLANEFFYKKTLPPKQDTGTPIATKRSQTDAKPAPVLEHPNISFTGPVVIPQIFERHILHPKLEELKPLINMQMLLGHHLGLRGQVAELLKRNDLKAVQLTELVDSFFADNSKQVFRPKAVYRFFPAQSEDDSILIYDPQNNNTFLERFTFPRQEASPYLCLADYIRPVQGSEMDYIGLFVVTAGDVKEMADKYKETGEYLASYALQAAALQLAEANADFVHRHIREQWGLEQSIGKRFSPGYAVWPDIEDQQKIFQLLHPEDIYVELTDGFMMVPEASVSAIVIAHPEARYFKI